MRERCFQISPDYIPCAAVYRIISSHVIAVPSGKLGPLLPCRRLQQYLIVAVLEYCLVYLVAAVKKQFLFFTCVLANYVRSSGQTRRVCASPVAITAEPFPVEILPNQLVVFATEFLVLGRELNNNMDRLLS